MSLIVDIHKHYASFDLNIAFEADHETLGFLGTSGCGKSLTLRSIAGIETPDEGKIVVNGKTYFDRAAGKRARIDLSPQERKSALLFQNYQLFPNLTVEANIAAGIPKEELKRSDGTLVKRQLQRFGLTGLEKRYPLQLSGGQQQRVALARMLAADPDILMLDEPFSALDAHLKSELEQRLLELFAAYEGTILYVSHDIDEAFRFCDRIAVVSNGSIDELSPKESLIREPQSLAAIRLSGCKNTTPAEYRDEFAVHLPEWGVTLRTAQPVPHNVKWLGIRAYHLERVESELNDAPAHQQERTSSTLTEDADEVCANIFRMRCDRVSDSRFERAVMASFIGSTGDPLPNVLDIPREPRYLIPDSVRERLSLKAPSRSESPTALFDADHEEQVFFKTHVRWNIDKHMTPESQLPQKGDIVSLRFPPDALYLVTR